MKKIRHRIIIFAAIPFVIILVLALLAMMSPQYNIRDKIEIFLISIYFIPLALINLTLALFLVAIIVLELRYRPLQRYLDHSSRRLPRPYLFSGLGLLLLSVILGISGITFASREVQGILILVAFTSFISGVLILTFYQQTTINPAFADLLSVAGILNNCSILRDLKSNSPAQLLFRENIPGGLVQYNPSNESTPLQFQSSDLYGFEASTRGIVSVPTGLPLLERLESDYRLIIPSVEENLYEAIQEVLVEVLEVAETIQFKRIGNCLSFYILGFRFLPTCLKIQKQSPNCCTVVPCPICSLIACMVSRGLQVPLTFQPVTPVPEEDGILLSIILTSPD